MSIKPDLGLFYLSNGLDEEREIIFPEIVFSDVDFISEELCSVMFEVPFGENGETYAISMDFHRNILREIILKLPKSLQEKFINENDNRYLPFQADLPQPVIASVTCRLGEIQTTSGGDQFVPFVIHSIE